MHVIKADSKLVTVSYFNETQRCSNISSNFYFGTLFKTNCVDFLGSKNIANSHEKKELIFNIFLFIFSFYRKSLS